VRAGLQAVVKRRKRQVAETESESAAPKDTHICTHAATQRTHARTHARTPAESADGAGQDWLARPVIITAFALVCSSRHLRLLLECLEVGAPANTTKIAHYITYNNLLPLPTQHPPYI
jgi:hypothetical protein